MAGSIFDELKKLVPKKVGFANAGDVKSDSEIRAADPKTLSPEELKRLEKLNK